MNKDVFYRMETVYEACKNSNNQRIAIPLIKRIQFIDGEMYATVTDFCNDIGEKINDNVKERIVEKINMLN